MRKMHVVLVALALLSLGAAPVMAEAVVPGGTTPYAWYRADVGVSTVGGGDNTVTGWADQSGNVRNLGTVNGLDAIPDPVGENNWVVTSASYTTGTSDTVCVNGVEIINGNLLSSGMAGIVVGTYAREAASKGWFKGDLAELIVFGGALSAAERLEITEALMARWSAGNLVIKPGDANSDGFVNEADAAILAENWQTQGGATWFMGDFNEDDNVDDIDATMMAANWGTGPGVANAAVPEPGSLLLLVSGLLALLLFFEKMNRLPAHNTCDLPRFGMQNNILSRQDCWINSPDIRRSELSRLFNISRHQTNFITMASQHHF